MESMELLYERQFLIQVVEKKRQYLAVRRMLELGLICTFSVMIIFVLGAIGLYIAIFDKGPVFFIQKRRGHANELINVYKFRTMFPNVDSRKLTLKDDDRITPIGHFLRKYKLDELPQLINVFQGDMSLVGPRPVPNEFFELYKENIVGYTLRHLVTPGITGLAQIEQGYTSTVEEERIKLTYDLEYIRNLGWKSDLLILAKTFGLFRL